MEKKEYIAPLTETTLMAVEHLMIQPSKEEFIDPGHLDAKENSFMWDDFEDNEEEPNPYDLWGDN